MGALAQGLDLSGIEGVKLIEIEKGIRWRSARNVLWIMQGNCAGKLGLIFLDECQIDNCRITIPGKGRLARALAAFLFGFVEQIKIRHCFVLNAMFPDVLSPYARILKDRFLLVEVVGDRFLVPIKFIIIAGKKIQFESSDRRLISRDEAEAEVEGWRVKIGREERAWQLFQNLELMSEEVFEAISEFTEKRGVVIHRLEMLWAWDRIHGGFLLASEVATFDCACLYPKDLYRPDQPSSYYYPCLQDWALIEGWDGRPLPPVPEELIQEVRSGLETISCRLLPETVSRTILGV